MVRNLKKLYDRRKRYVVTIAKRPSLKEAKLSNNDVMALSNGRNIEF